MNDVTQQIPKDASKDASDELSENVAKEASTKITDSENPAQKNQQQSTQQETQHQMEQILAQTEKVNEQLTKFHKHKFVQAYNSIPRLLWFQLLKGVAFGLGSVLGATVVLSALVYLLSQIEFIPFIGEWVSEILEVVKTQVPN
jgi:hypothetical protein